MNHLGDLTAVLVAAEQVAVATSQGELLLDDVSLVLNTGELVVIMGPSGAGKTTLLETLAGLRRPSRGRVALPGRSGACGYVPQADIVHAELTVMESIRFAALLRYGRTLTATAVDDAVTTTLDELGLTHRAHVPVASVSGGQRKRVSIGTELVARPAVCFLDEPTSGLDPAAAGDLMATLAALAAHGTAVVMTSHNLADLRSADRLIVIAPGGRVEYDGSVTDGPAEYRAFGTDRRPKRSGARLVAPIAAAPRTVPLRAQVPVLTRRNIVVLARNRMSAAIMAGSPIAVVAMMAVLFRDDAAGPSAPHAGAAHAFAYWLAFAGFFFGLTFGLLQICGELPILQRELRRSVNLDAYLVAKGAVLVPIVAAVDVVMTVVLMAIGRISWTGTDDLARLLLLLGLDSLAGLTIGLLASAAVTGPVQATLALPMLCFPAVLFGGAIVSVDSMTSVGRGLAAVTSTRWSFDAISTVLVPGRSGANAPVVALAVIAVVTAIAARVVLAHRVRAR